MSVPPRSRASGVSADKTSITKEFSMMTIDEYVKNAATGDSPFAMEDDCGYLVPFTEADFEALRDHILERIS